MTSTRATTPAWISGVTCKGGPLMVVRVAPVPDLSGPPGSAEDRLRGLLAANRSVVSELALPGVLRRIVEAARAVAGARYAALGVIGADGLLEQFIHSGMDADMVERIGHLPTGRGVLGALIEQPEPIRLHADLRRPAVRRLPAGSPAHARLPRGAGASRGEVFGNLYLADRARRADFSADDEELVVALAASAGVAIENARLYEESRRRQEWLRASAEISRDLLRPGLGDEVLVRIADAVLRLADADVVTLDFPQGDDPDATRATTRRRPPTICRRGRTRRGDGRPRRDGIPLAGPSLAGTAMRERRAGARRRDRAAPSRP